MREGNDVPSPPAGLKMAEPFRLKGLKLKNRVVRSSIGGKLGYYDGSPNEAWMHFEKRFARTGVAALISATVSVDERRYSPLEYLKIADDRFIEPLRAAIARVKRGVDVAYILQIGDPGYHTQASLFPQTDDSKSSSAVFDLLYGYRSHSSAMSLDDIARSVRAHADGARRAKEAGADGVEITLSKGYLAHQFLNPGVNHRSDDYGGSVDKRFRFAREVVSAVRHAVGPAFPLGVRLSTADHNYLPINLRLPMTFPLRRWALGNGLEETTHYAKELEGLGVDWLHLSRGFGFINPKESPGALPVDAIRRVYNSVSHLSAKAWFRALVMNLTPDVLIRAILGIGWKAGDELGATGRIAAEFRRAVKIPIIANGGFQSRALIEETLGSGNCDLISMTRPLLANPDLLAQLHDGDLPARPCTFCNNCSMLTAVVPIGCYDPTRFPSQDEMEAHILRWGTDPDLGREAVAADEVPADVLAGAN
jgi:2,4-dienoyl-CoA reductase-like NADH-dependent reductase (Old Yellow Enzyme family)